MNFLFAFLLLSASFIKESTCDVVDDAMVSDIATYNVRGAGIAVFDSAQVDAPIARGYGRIGSASNSPLVTADTTFMLASVSKVFAAAAVSVLVDQNIVGLDDDICDVVSPAGWKKSACRNPSFPNDKVTWRMLVTHRSSLRENIPSVRNSNGEEVEAGYGPLGGYAEGTAVNPTCPLDDVTGFYRDFLTDKATETSVGASITLQGGSKINWYSVGQSDGGAWQNYRPGSRVSYSNFAVGYIAALVELATGESFPEFCRVNLFEPLGMTNTAWLRKDLPSGTRQAIPVEFFGGGFDSIGHYCYIDYASGQLHTSARDIAKWGEAMLSFGAPTLWSESTGEQVFKCQERNAQGNAPSNCEFAMGWSRLDNSMKPNAEGHLNAFKKYDWTNGGVHEGAEAGSQTHLIVLPNAGVFASVLTNTDLNDEYAPQKMVATLANTPLPFAPTPFPVQAPTPNPPVPVPKPTPSPVPDPSPNPVPAPTPTPVLKPTPSPVSNPTPNPVVAPTLSPVPKPTPSPVSNPTPNPVAAPTSSPVPNPTPSPIPEPGVCSDSDTLVWINNAKGFKSCSWLSGRNFWKNSLCGWETDADYYCRETCDSCSYWETHAAAGYYTPVGRPNGCFDLDNIEFFVNNRIGMKRCSWLAGNNFWQNELCGYNTDADHACRSTCGSCDFWN